MRGVTIMLSVVCALSTGCRRPPNNQLGITVHGRPTSERIEEWIKILRTTPQVIVFFEQWPSQGNQLTAQVPTDSLASIHTNNIIPCLSWEPQVIIDNNEEPVLYESIVNGDYDPYIQRVAESITLHKNTVWIRFAHEMNLNHYHWGVTEQEYNADAPQKYRAMFRYIVTKFREYGVTNAKWVFCPNSESIPDLDWNTIPAYWPGADVVDILGVDGYNWGTTQTLAQNGWESNWRTFQSIFGPAILTLKKLADDKPLYIMETATVRQGGDRNVWITDMVEQAALQNINGICWFQADKENDWSLDPQLDQEGLNSLRQWSQ